MGDNSTSRPFKVSKPPDFDGNKEQFSSWFRHVLMYFESQDVVPSPKQKILFTMSYMKSGFAAEWAALAFDREKARPSADRWNWNTFTKDLKSTFSPINEVRDAQERLAGFTQGEMSIEEYLTRWKQILITAEYSDIRANTTTADQLINLLRSNVRLEIIDSVDEESEMYSCRDLEKWLNHILVKGKILERRQNRLAAGSTPVTPSPPATGYANGAEIPYGDEGEPMDLSCQHASRKYCKDHAQEIRLKLENLPPEERKEFLREIGA